MSFDIKIGAEETARLAWIQFGPEWSLPGRLTYQWLYDLQEWPLGKRRSSTAQSFLYQVWDMMKSMHGESNLEDDIAERVLQRFGQDWEANFTRRFLAEEVGKTKLSKGVCNMHARICDVLRNLQPPTFTASAPSASSACAPSSSSASAHCQADNDSGSDPIGDAQCFLSKSTHYEILSLSFDERERLTNEDVQKAFRVVALQWHPDKAEARGVPKAMATMIMQKINDAKEVLVDVQKKRTYDQRLRQRFRRTAESVGQSTSRCRPVSFVKEGSALESGTGSSAQSSAVCFPSVWDRFSQLSQGERHMELPQHIHWLEGRREYLLHHIDLIDEHASELAPTDTHQFSILCINMGNLNRHGQISGYHHDNMVMTYCVGKFHLVLLAEAWLNRNALRTCATFGCSVFGSSSGSLGVWILGNGRNPRCETLVENTVYSEGVRADGSRKWHLDYMVSQIFWGFHDDGLEVKRCGVESVRCGIAHLNNRSAQKPRVSMIKSFWEAMLDARAQVVFGDFNARAYFNVNNVAERENNTIRQCLEEAIATCQVHVTFQMLRVDAGVMPGQFVLSDESEQDCLLLFLLDYDDVDFQITKQRVTKSSAPLDNEQLGLAPTDTDWHMPMLVHVRASFVPSGKRQRTEQKKAARKLADTQRRNAAKRLRTG